MHRARHDLVQEEGHELLVGDEAPEVELQVVAVDLDLLEAVAGEGPQSYALQERFQGDLDDSRENGDLCKKSLSIIISIELFLRKLSNNLRVNRT